MRRCGSGVVSAFVSNLVKENAVMLCTDVNRSATETTRSVVHSTKSDFVCADLLACIQPRQQFSLVVFNPPYVPTDEEEYQRSLRDRDIFASWAGGRNGRQVTDRFLADVGPYLANDGVMYLVLIDLNDVTDTLDYARKYGLLGTIAAKRLSGIELLYVLRFSKISAIRESATF